MLVALVLVSLVALAALFLLWRQSSTILRQRAQIVRMTEQLHEVNAVMAKLTRQKVPGVRSVGDPP